LPRVAEGALGEERALQVITLVPGRRPLAELAAALASVKAEGEGAPPSSRLDVGDDPESMVRALQRRVAHGSGVVFFVDQLEELLTLAKPADAVRFAEVLARLGSVAAGVRVLATVRGDFFTRLVALPGLGEELARALYVLRPLDAHAIRAAITGPARRTGVKFESEALVDALVEEGAEAAGGLPLLQFAMAELWEARDLREQRIPAAALDAIGGVAGALARHADAVIAALGSAEQAAARSILVRLVTAEGTRARRTPGELVRGLGDPVAGPALEALIRGRLVVAREVVNNDRGSLPNSTAGIAYEVAHEALIRGWGTLRRWLEEDSEERRVRARIEAAAAEWARLGRASEALWSERQLAEAVRIPAEVLGPEERDFLAASRRRIRRVRIGRIAMIAGAPLVVVLAFVGLQLKERYDRDQFRLAAQYDIDAKIEAHRLEASWAMEEGRQRKAEADALRIRAFARFDAASGERRERAQAVLEEAEKIWSEALEVSRAADDALSRASQSFEAGLSFDAGRVGLRAGLSEALLERLELAEWFHHQERREDLARRLALYDGKPATSPRLSVVATPAGAEVEIARYQQDEQSGHRVRGAPWLLGRTPIAEAEVIAGPGSYVLTLRAEGREEVRYPILLGHGELSRVVLDMPRAGTIPQGYVYVPPGRFLFGSADPESLRLGTIEAQPEHEVTTGGYLIGKNEVTFAEWIDFLRELPPAERAPRIPRSEGTEWKLHLEELPEGPWKLTLVLNGKSISAREGENIRIEGRRQRVEQDWRRFPVTGISPEDAHAYAEFLARGRVPGARMCDEREWERAARGADNRPLPHGDRLAPADANFDQTYGHQSEAYGPDEVGAHPASASPFGPLDMVGNAFEMVRSAAPREDYLIRGGAWYHDVDSARSNNRSVIEPRMRNHLTGLRICADFIAR
jgi:formylglycine-generating enzyme required for sulfatase activity